MSKRLVWELELCKVGALLRHLAAGATGVWFMSLVLGVRVKRV